MFGVLLSKMAKKQLNLYGFIRIPRRKDGRVASSRRTYAACLKLDMDVSGVFFECFYRLQVLRDFFEFVGFFFVPDNLVKVA